MRYSQAPWAQEAATGWMREAGLVIHQNGVVT